MFPPSVALWRCSGSTPTHRSMVLLHCISYTVIRVAGYNADLGTDSSAVRLQKVCMASMVYIVETFGYICMVFMGRATDIIRALHSPFIR